jgi:hypothetical protein
MKKKNHNNKILINKLKISHQKHNLSIGNNPGISIGIRMYM